MRRNYTASAPTESIAHLSHLLHLPITPRFNQFNPEFPFLFSDFDSPCVMKPPPATGLLRYITCWEELLRV